MEIWTHEKEKDLVKKPTLIIEENQDKTTRKQAAL